MITIDCEYIPENAAQGDTPGGRPDVKTTYCELMQIGACKLDGQGREIGVLNLVVKAHRIEFIPLWLQTMTGMTPERRARGMAFSEALRNLQAFIGTDQDIWVMNGDWWVLWGNARAHHIELPYKEQFKRLKPMLPDLGITLPMFEKAGFTEVISGGLYKVLGINLPITDGHEHDALHDARSLAYSIYKLGLAASVKAI